eukprot:gene10531-21954_t
MVLFFRQIICAIFIGVSIAFYAFPIKSHYRPGIDLSVYKLNYETDLPKNFPTYSDCSFGLLELKDLDEACDLSSDCFFKPLFKVNSASMAPVEKFIVDIFSNMSTSFEQSDHRFGTYLGFQTRSARRLRKPNLLISSDSMVLTATNTTTGKIIGLVEICLEPATGKLAPPIQSPWKPPPSPTDEPYLCNLCIAKDARRKGLGKILCQLGEHLVQKYWQKRRMYLHVELSNLPAQMLYVGLKYSPTPIFQSFWESKVNGVDNLLYFQKTLQPWTTDEDSRESVTGAGNISLSIFQQGMKV